MDFTTPIAQIKGGLGCIEKQLEELNKSRPFPENQLRNWLESLHASEAFFKKSIAMNETLLGDMSELVTSYENRFRSFKELGAKEFLHSKKVWLEQVEILGGTPSQFGEQDNETMETPQDRDASRNSSPDRDTVSRSTPSLTSILSPRPQSSSSQSTPFTFTPGINSATRKVGIKQDFTYSNRPPIFGPPKHLPPVPPTSDPETPANSSDSDLHAPNGQVKSNLKRKPAVQSGPTEKRVRHVDVEEGRPNEPHGGSEGDSVSRKSAGTMPARRQSQRLKNNAESKNDGSLSQRND